MLQGPRRRGVVDDVHVHQPPTPHLEDYEEVQDAERGRDRHAEVAGQQGPGWTVVSASRQAKHCARRTGVRQTAAPLSCVRLSGTAGA